MDGPVKQLAENLRRLRSARGLSLSALARQSGVNKATLSRLEAAEGNPTVETVWALATALGVPWGQLASGRPSPELVRSGDGVLVPGSATGARLIRSVSTGPSLLEWYELVLHPDPAPSAPHALGVREDVWALDGAAIVGPVGGEVELARGDFVSFLADVPHVYQPATSAEVRLLLLMHYPPATVRDGDLDGTG